MKYKQIKRIQAVKIWKLHDETMNDKQMQQKRTIHLILNQKMRKKHFFEKLKTGYEINGQMYGIRKNGNLIDERIYYAHYDLLQHECEQ